MCLRVAILFAIAVHFIKFTSTSSKFQFRRTYNTSRLPSRNYIFTEELLCYSNASYVHNHTCHIRQVAQERTAALVQFFLIESCNEFEAHVKFFYLYSTEERLVFDKWKNICAYLNGTTRSLPMNLIVPKVLKYSNFNHSCPYSGEVLFKADRIDVSEMMIQNFLPTDKFRLDIRLTNGPHRSLVFQVVDKFTNMIRVP